MADLSVIPEKITKRLHLLKSGKGDSLQERAHAIRLQLIEDGDYNPSHELVNLTPKHKRIIRLHFEGMSKKSISRSEEVHYLTVTTATLSPLGRAYYEQLMQRSEEAVVQSRAHMATLAPRAVRVVDKLLPKEEEEFEDMTKLREVENIAWKVIDKTFPKAPTTSINVNTQTNIAVVEKEMHQKSEAEILDVILTGDKDER